MTEDKARCSECGAMYALVSDGCSARFERLLALDHSRQEPWGSRHGQAFAAFALQHPLVYASSLDLAWLALHRIYVMGDSPARVFGALRAAGGGRVSWDAPARPAQRRRMPVITIADLGDFASATYPERLDDWCRESLDTWGPLSTT